MRTEATRLDASQFVAGWLQPLAHERQLDRTAPFPLTPALSRREREHRSQRWTKLGSFAQQQRAECILRGRAASLSQRERAGVREDGHELSARLQATEMRPPVENRFLPR